MNRETRRMAEGKMNSTKRQVVDNIAIGALLLVAISVFVMMLHLVPAFDRPPGNYKCVRSGEWIKCTEKSFHAADLREISLITEHTNESKIITLKGEFGEIKLAVSGGYYDETMKVLETAIDENGSDR